MSRAGLAVLALLLALLAGCSDDRPADVWRDGTNRGRDNAAALADEAACKKAQPRDAYFDTVNDCMKQRGWWYDEDKPEGASGPANAGAFFLLFGLLPMGVFLVGGLFLTRGFFTASGGRIALLAGLSVAFGLACVRVALAIFS
jgi:hypothetical protein